ncbi:MAG TPA: hypothetical protein VHS03_10630 [Gaiellaceae bacterium]|nr:hypothetical protein [Gaiellaceae bacterium]
MSRTFVVEIESSLEPEEVRRLVLTKLSRPLGDADYMIENQNETMISFARTYRPYFVPAVLLFWLVFPLFFLLIEQTDRVMVTLIASHGGTSIVVVGTGPGAMRKQFEQLAQADWPVEAAAR